MLQISSSSTNQSPSARKLCRCGGYIKTWTSWTDLNPRRRFEACEMSRRNKGNGHHWELLDATTCAIGKELIPRLLRRMRAMEKDLKLIEEQKKEVEDKLKMVEREKKELEYKVGELGRQKRVLEVNRMGQRPRENRIWGISFMSLGLGFLVFMMMLCILSNWLTFPGGNFEKLMIN
ncbi:uncharacterized protein Pyn_39805 [Prunus yedoensis var. nudiflora]|uniref:Uncharacterized protein n=1 Tax=Prunus yedoensis var. nudiflora TaxID=2094558 RepID=A0A314UCV5_PRUYE|nr:uncharacterized protein Pyn_39805 [Prunus yedoensis var. nudiflora]